MEPENQEALLPFLQRLRAELPEKDIWLYTGYRLESVSDSPLLPLVDVVVDGPYIEEQKDVSLAFRGSRNQRIIHLRNGEAHDRSEND
jgi:anaerobic ribonucleoside-triphosphate reductase activating protein